MYTSRAQRHESEVREAANGKCILISSKRWVVGIISRYQKIWRDLVYEAKSVLTKGEEQLKKEMLNC